MEEERGIWREANAKELRQYFKGEHFARAGLRSKFGAQLARARDGLTGSADNPQDIPPELRGADRRAREIYVALMQIGEHGAILLGQYEDEPDQKLLGFECLLDDEAPSISKIKSEEEKTAVWRPPGTEWVKGKFRLQSTGEKARPAIFAIAAMLVPPWSHCGRPITDIIETLSFAPRENQATRIRAALKILCQRACGLARPGERKPSQPVRDAARDALGQLAIKALSLLGGAQKAYAQARGMPNARETARMEAFERLAGLR